MYFFLYTLTWLSLIGTGVIAAVSFMVMIDIPLACAFFLIPPFWVAGGVCTILGHKLLNVPTFVPNALVILGWPWDTIKSIRHENIPPGPRTRMSCLRLSQGLSQEARGLLEPPRLSGRKD